MKIFAFSLLLFVPWTLAGEIELPRHVGNFSGSYRVGAIVKETTNELGLKERSAGIALHAKKFSIGLWVQHDLYQRSADPCGAADPTCPAVQMQELRAQYRRNLEQATSVDAGGIRYGLRKFGVSARMSWFDLDVRLYDPSTHNRRFFFKYQRPMNLF